MLQKITETADYLKSVMKARPKTAIILGSGLGNLATQITERQEILYEYIPNFPVSTVKGHSGKLIVGKLGGVDVLAMQGRFHFYEGYPMEKVTFPVRVMKAIGIDNIVVSNAAGGVNPNFEIGEIMFINDHINLFPEHPLRGKNYDELGPRFPDMHEVYDKQLLRRAHAIADKHGIRVKEGVYVGTQGPTFETPAEYVFFRTIGGDAVGMSTVPEAIVAHHGGMRVFGVSIITDLGVPGKIVEVSHQEVLDIAISKEPLLTTIVTELIQSL